MEIHDDLFARREGEVDGRCRQVLHVEVGRRRHSFLSVHSFSTRAITVCHRPRGRPFRAPESMSWYPA